LVFALADEAAVGHTSLRRDELDESLVPAEFIVIGPFQSIILVTQLNVALKARKPVTKCVREIVGR
jgi:hypothetical protein